MCETKKCSKCLIEKTLDNFYKNSNNQKPVSICKECVNINHRIHYHNLDSEKKAKLIERRIKNYFKQKQELKLTGKITKLGRKEVQIIDNKKVCSKCKENKDISEFRKSSSTKIGLLSHCKSCEALGNKEKRNRIINKDFIVSQRESLKANFGLTIEEYSDMFEQQKGCCAICGNPETRISPKRNTVALFAVDHNHATNKIRELLCGSCNRALGLFKENIENLQNAINYLEKHKKIEE